jgi:ComF family protein
MPEVEAAFGFTTAGLVQNAWRRFVSAGWNALDPPACLDCRSPLHESSSWRFCEPCHQQLTVATGPTCGRCSAPVGPHLDTSAGCALCHDDRWAFDRAIALGVYGNALKSACIRAKSPSGHPLCTGLACLLWDRMAESLRAGQFELVVPVPHHWRDRVTRAYFPSQGIARCLAARLNIPMAQGIVVKTRRTPTQSSLSRAKRLKNLIGAFRLGGRPDLKGRNVLLVDDILTTGATAHRVALVLKEAGAARVTTVVLARAVGDG